MNMLSDQQKKVNVLIPVKVESHRKQRLSSLLNERERIAFTQAMLKDILCELKKSLYIADIYLVGDKDELSALAAEFSVNVFSAFDQSRSLNNDVTAACDFLHKQSKVEEINAKAILIVHADIPLLSVKRLDHYIAKFFETNNAQLITDKARSGTNAFIFSEQKRLKFQYGINSCEKHMAVLKSMNAACDISECEYLSFDVDTENDFLQLMQMLNARKESSWLVDFFKAYQADVYKVKKVV